MLQTCFVTTFRVALFVLGMGMTTGASSAADPVVPTDRAGYDKTVAPFFKQYCNECHTGAKPEGEFGVDDQRLSIRFGEASARQRWREVVNVLNAHEMPPESSKQPSPQEVTAVVDWITTQAVQAELILREQSVVLRRLNRAEYQNTIRDLVGVDFDPSGFPEDPAAGGFDNNGSALTMSPLHVEMYLAAARQILDRALVAVIDRRRLPGGSIRKSDRVTAPACGSTPRTTRSSTAVITSKKGTGSSSITIRGTRRSMPAISGWRRPGCIACGCGLPGENRRMNKSSPELRNSSNAAAMTRTRRIRTGRSSRNSRWIGTSNTSRPIGCMTTVRRG